MVIVFLISSIGTGYLSGAEKKRAFTDQEKIEYLIGSVEKLGDAVFYRNGTWYDARSAADHLRMKLRKAGSSVKTVDDFIVKIASRSYITGVPYRIRFANGHEADLEVFMRQRLQELDRQE